MSKSGTRAANKMGSIRRRSDGRWEGRYTGPDGRQRSVYGKTQKAAAEALRAATHDVDRGSWLEPSRMTVSEWLDEWRRDYCAHVNPRTLKLYGTILRLYIVPSVGPLRLAALNAAHVRHLVGDLQRREGEAALSASTIRMALRVLNIALNAAVEAKLLRENVAQSVPLPRQDRPEMHIIDRPMFPSFIQAAQSTSCPEALVLMLQTGLRAGELCGLCWEDWNEAAGVLRVRRQLVGNTLDAPKDGSARDIVVGPEVAATLRAQRRRVAALKLSAGEKWSDDGFHARLIFRSRTGAPLSRYVLAHAVTRVADALNLPGLHPHDLRHSYAVAALRAGADPKTVQHNLGHTSAAMTLDVYAAYTTDAAAESARRLSDYWTDATN